MCDADFAPLVERIRNAADFARGVGEMTQDAEAEVLWDEAYALLSRPRHGVFGGITGRAAAQVLRLSCLYALLDRSRVVTVRHLRAALALWAYCEDSARYIFGESTGNRAADDILKALRGAGEAGLTRSEISIDLFNRNVSTKQITEALDRLRQAKLARCAKEHVAGAKRPAERWFALPSQTVTAAAEPVAGCEATRAGGSTTSLISCAAPEVSSGEMLDRAAAAGYGAGALSRG